MTSKPDIDHEEAWDDSLLVDSWNDAVEEYKQYHSIQARGEDIEEVLKAHENQRQTLSEEKADYEEQVEKLPSNDQLSGPNLPVGTAGHNIQNTEQFKNKPLNPYQTSDSGSTKAPALPQHLIGQVHDEGLKNLLMSWYYAGYYTGLHEGKQQQMDAKHEN